MRPAILLATLALVGCATSTTTTQPDNGASGSSPSGGPESDAEPPGTSAGLRGELDPTFAQGPNAALDQILSRVLDVDPEGRIYVGGETPTCLPNGEYVYVVVRLDASGALDPTFAKGGRLCMQRGLRVEALTAAADGSLYLAGSSPEAGFGFVDHYNRAGVSDDAFGGARVYASAGSSAWFLHLAVLDGGVIAVGQLGNSGLVAKFGADGKLVPKFGTAGIVVSPDKSGSYSRPVVVGDQLVVSALGSDDFNNWELQSFHTTTGAMKRHSQMPLPILVGRAGIALSVAAPDLVLGRTGDLFVGGYREEGNSNDRVAVGRIKRTLAPDTGFGEGGMYASDVFVKPTFPNLVPTSGDAVIVAANDTRSGGKYGSAALVRVTAQGQLDTSFGDGGIRLFTDPAARPSSVLRIAEDRASGKVVVLAKEGISPTLRIGDGALLYRVR